MSLSHVAKLNMYKLKLHIPATTIILAKRMHSDFYDFLNANKEMHSEIMRSAWHASAFSRAWSSTNSEFLMKFTILWVAADVHRPNRTRKTGLPWELIWSLSSSPLDKYWEEIQMKEKIQSFGRFLSGMVMPNIGAFIACIVVSTYAEWMDARR